MASVLSSFLERDPLGVWHVMGRLSCKDEVRTVFRFPFSGNF